MNDRDKEADLWKLADAFFGNLEREQHMEYGGWGLDDKRPFGNSDVHDDILEIINCSPVVDDYQSREQEDYAAELYDELGGFLQTKWVEFREASRPPAATSVPDGSNSDAASR